MLMWALQSGLNRAAALRSFRALVTLGMLTIAALIAHAQAVDDRSGLNGFLEAFGGKVPDVSKAWASEPELNLYLRNRQNVLGLRATSEKRPHDALNEARRGRALFSQECGLTGGVVEKEDSLATVDFVDRVIKPVIGERRGLDYWRGLVAICSASNGKVLGNYVAVIHDTTDVATRGDVGSRLLTNIFGLPTTTTIYAFAPRSVVESAVLAEEKRNAEAARSANAARDLEGLRRFQADLKIGTATSCGTVIQIREPMVEIALPPRYKTPNGLGVYWTRRDKTLPITAISCPELGF